MTTFAALATLEHDDYILEYYKMLGNQGAVPKQDRQYRRSADGVKKFPIIKLHILKKVEVVDLSHNEISNL